MPDETSYTKEGDAAGRDAADRTRPVGDLKRFGEDSGKKDVAELRALLRRIEEKSKQTAARRRPPVDLETAIPGKATSTARGMFYLIEEDASRFLHPEDEFEAVTDLFFRRRQADRQHLSRLDAALAQLADMEAGRMLFLDIETAGFHGMGLFLIGLLTYEERRFRVRQLFARDYGEEAAAIEHLREYYEKCEAVITFNGRCFDLPFIADRAVIHRVSLKRPDLDVDLLPVARRIWKGTLPDCRLGTLEQYVCGRRRAGDVPGHMIPQVYHEFVENRDAYLMVDVMRHNAYDLVTMAHLLARMVNG